MHGSDVSKAICLINDISSRIHTNENGRNGLKNIYLIRHGTTKENKARTLIGQLDPPLADESKVLLKSIRAPFVPDMIYSSPLRRAHETATLLFPDRTIVNDPDVMERCFGDFEGKLIEELGKGSNGRTVYDFKDEATLVSNGGEPIGELEARIRRFIDRLLKTDARTIAVVSHGTLISHMVGVLLGEETSRASPMNLHLVHFILDKDGNASGLRYDLSMDEI